MKKLAIKIPLIHIGLITLLAMVIQWVIAAETQGKSVLSKALFSMGFFLTNSFYTITLAVLLIAPAPLLIYAVLRNRKDLIPGLAISTAISAILIAIISLS
jgi:hypothetical protein